MEGREMTAITTRLTNRVWPGRAPADLMASYAAEDAKGGRNDPCTWGSGRKWTVRHRSEAAPATRPGSTRRG